MHISAEPAADDPATLYACDVLDGKVVAGELFRAACARHLRDLDNGSARGLRPAVVYPPRRGVIDP